MFCTVENDYLIAFYKWNDDRTDETLTVISLDSHNTQQGMVQLPLEALKVSAGHAIIMKDLITDNSYTWSSEWNYVELSPALPFHVFHINK